MNFESMGGAPKPPSREKSFTENQDLGGFDLDPDVLSNLMESGKSLDSFPDPDKQEMFAEALTFLNKKHDNITDEQRRIIEEKKKSMISIMRNKYPEEEFSTNSKGEYIIKNPTLH